MTTFNRIYKQSQEIKYSHWIIGLKPFLLSFKNSICNLYDKYVKTFIIYF